MNARVSVICFHTSMDSLQVEQPAAASGTSGVQPNWFSGLFASSNLLSVRPFEQYRDYPRETWQTLLHNNRRKTKQIRRLQGDQSSRSLPGSPNCSICMSMSAASEYTRNAPARSS